ncbi:MAG TPA: MmcQ/YjbR family DNA-binding protein [Acidimicrobiales bacterium]|nr:MmcQ/YjbR family DNA-binding protein [Acidimicrobiales bacterium]
MEWGQVPVDVEEKLRAICLALPDAHEQDAWNGRRWLIRQRTFAHVFAVERPEGPVPMMQFRSDPPEFEALVRSGHPFFKAGWGSNVLAMIFDDRTDWDEVAELVADSYCSQAPKKLAALVNGRVS